METQVRKVIYEDETGRLHGVLETDGRFFIHSELYEPEKISVLKHYRSVLQALETNLHQRGLRQYYTMADSPTGFRFNEFMGFKSNYEVWDNLYEVMVKDI